MMKRTVFNSEHELFRTQVRRFFETEVAPHHAAWEKAGIVPRELWRKAGESGFLCTSVPEAYGGSGADRRYAAVLLEEQARSGWSGPGFSVHSEIGAPYILAYGTEAQKSTWLPKLASGEAILAIGLTEPSAGSDLKNIRTTAVRDGDDYVINGAKTFISNGKNADLVILAVKTDPTKAAAGVSLMLVEGDRAGFTRGAPLHKIGNKAQDTCELFFDNVRVPASNLLGAEGEGFSQLMKELAWERLQIAISAVAAAEASFVETLAYARDRKAFGKSIIEFQNSRFVMAELKTKISVSQAFVDQCIETVCNGELQADEAAMAKYWCTDMLCEVVDACLQLHGGYGYILEYPIARAYADARVTRIYGGANEIMKEIVGRAL